MCTSGTLAPAEGNSAGNFGYLEGNINNNSLDNLLDSLTGTRIFRSIESEIADAEPYIFTPLDIKWTRNTNSEFRMLNKLALSLNLMQKSLQFLNHEGTLKIISENAYCTSCQGIVVQFNKMFPKINIVLIDATKI